MHLVWVNIIYSMRSYFYMVAFAVPDFFIESSVQDFIYILMGPWRIKFDN